LKQGLTSPLACKRQLWDFAFAGADVAEEFTPLHHSWTVPLVNQTQQYLTWAEPVIGKSMDKSKALVAVWTGINDINDSAKYNVSFPALYNSIIDAIFEKTVQPMYDAGYHNFLFVNLPPLDRTPGNHMSPNPLPNKTMIGWWDQTLHNHTISFTAENPTATAMLFDANTFLNHVLDHPEEYGIKDTTSYCRAYDQLGVLTDPESYGCRPLDQYFWFNTGHM
jgi:phospholipase/lecithinase/hemolysin